MLAERRGRRADRAGRAAQLDRDAELPDRPGGRMVERHHHRPLQNLRVGEHLLEVPDAAARNPRRLEVGQPLGRRPRPQPLDEHRPQRLPRGDAVLVGAEARVGGEVVRAEHPAERAPELIVADRDDQLAVGRLERLVRRDRRMPVAEPSRRGPGGEVDPRLVGQHRRHRVEHPDVDELSAAGAVPRQQGGRDAVGGEHPGDDVGDRHPEAVGRPVLLAGDAHQPALALQNRVVARLAPPRAGLPEPGDGTVDEAGPPPGHLGVSQPHAIQRAGPEVLHQDVGALEQGVEHPAAVRVLQVEGDALLVAVDAQEVRALARLERRPPRAGVVPLARLLHLDDARAHVGEHHRAVGAGEDAGEVEHGHAVERAGRLPGRRRGRGVGHRLAFLRSCSVPRRT